jgi:hypothetical protein
MSAALIIQLLTTFGPSAVNLVTTLINQIESNQSVTAAQWATLAAALQQTARDRLTLQLQSAGIDPTSTQGVALLALVGK